MSNKPTDQNNSSQRAGITVNPEISECIHQILTHLAMMDGYNKEAEPWQKRELESAIICGENLVKIRQSYGKAGTGFKQFIMDEFKNEFIYPTALRYMKLYNGRNEITIDVTNLRQAYIKLGILKESYSYPDIESDSNGSSGSNDGKTKQGQQPKQRKAASKPTLNDLLKHGDSIYMTRKDDENSSTHIIYEFKLTANNSLLVRRVAESDKYYNANADRIAWFVERLKPIVDWHNDQTGTFVNVTPATFESSRELQIAA